MSDIKKKKICIILIALILSLLGKMAVSTAQTEPELYTNNYGSVSIEAEDVYVKNNLFALIGDVYASGGETVAASKNYTLSVPSVDNAGLKFDLNVSKDTKYYVWVLAVGANMNGNSIYVSIDNGQYQYGGIRATDFETYIWSNVMATPILNTDSPHTIKIHPRKAGVKIDKIIVNTNGILPSVGAELLTPSPEEILPSGQYPMPTITPPLAHPRLLFRETDIPGIQANMSKIKNQAAMNEYNTHLSQSFNMPENHYYHAETFGKIESWALDYAVSGTMQQGQKAVSALLQYLPLVDFSQITSDASRAYGHVIFTASEVYDWCYPILTEEQKYTIRLYCEMLARNMEIGWPPINQNAVSGHAGEAQLLRDLLSFGIAVYNERPDIYNFCAGRYFGGFTDIRNYWYDSHTHHQGDSYGAYRFAWEMWSEILINKMSGVHALSSQAEFVPYQWIYTRRPDGQLFREGDSYGEKWTPLGKYWDTPSITCFYSAAAFENPYARWLFEKTDPQYNQFSYANNSLSPVQMLLLNHPDASVTPPDDLPLSKYFPSPNGLLVARTGWEDATNNPSASSDVVAFMKIGEVWGSNHHHFDAGNFQIYYKGILASESGLYDSYASVHDTKYNKETIAHNSLLIYDPNENVSNGNNSGGQRRPDGEIQNLDEWIGNDTSFRIGEVIGHEIGPDSARPEYSYIKGDITKAYSGKVSEVLRTMLFMPLKDQNYPAIFFVFDKIISVNPDFKKTWLVHCQEQPEIDGNITVIKRTKQKLTGQQYYDGRMHIQTLLPKNPNIIPVGGEGNEFNISGINYPPGYVSGTSKEPGWGRVEVSSVEANTVDYFLNVMCVSDNSKDLSGLSAALIETNSVAGAEISNRVVVLNKGKARLNDTIRFNVPNNETNNLEFLVAGVQSGVWNVYLNSMFVKSVTASQDGGIAYFSGNAGEYTMIRQADVVPISMVNLNTSGNLIQTAKRTQAVQFTATVAPSEHMDANTVQWFVNGILQETTGLCFSFTPTELGSYEITAKVKDNSEAITDTKYITVARYGDINADGAIDISDVIMTAEIAVGTEGYTDEQCIRANVNDQENMEVDISDVILVAENAVGDVTLFPVER